MAEKINLALLLQEHVLRCKMKPLRGNKKLRKRAHAFRKMNRMVNWSHKKHSKG